MKTYFTERPKLRHFRPDDAKAAFEYMGNHENTKYTRSGVQSYESCVNFISGLSEEDYVFAVEFEGKVIGTAELSLCEDNQGTLGWIIHRDFWGRGFCTEVGRLLLKIAFEESGLRRVIAHCDTENTASWHVMEKIGMRREGCFIGGRCAYAYDPYRYGDEYSYGILIEEYKKRRQEIG